MAELASLARPYAKAAFSFAKEQGEIAVWEQFLTVAGQVVASDEFEPLLSNTTIAAQDKCDVLLHVLTLQTPSPVAQILDSVRSAGVDVDVLLPKSSQSAGMIAPNANLKNFVQQLADNDRLALLPNIARQFGDLKNNHLKQVDAYVTSAYPLTDQERLLLQQALARRENATVILHEAVDDNLLGGAVIKVGDKVTDGSVRGKLIQLKTQLMA